ncbi:hypothetical protein QPL79_04770 [Ignisphaera sp. 4213-co]|uniref:UDP-N-acetylglucosamine--dolichyl-phosphate N-acetylglucosaminephosphotransferase n=1 Tax=Ignisphaera cupida TaxID=3050454 RepID=A0ABD4Z6T9_9CREN|nr:hypothetical protein [Ignisphaera sp. 4213-co]MDK6028667.1 hypothetical protein [Ignisphaera sp. 4213-co]
MDWLFIQLATAFATVLSAIASIAIEKRLGILCVDVHKPSKPKIPCNGGFAIFIGLVTGFSLLLYSGYVDAKHFEAFTLSIIASFVIGFVDDLVDLKSRWKIILGFVSAAPVLLLGVYTPRPWIPLVGYIRISNLYPLLLLVAFTVYQNGANMIDTHNGTLPIFVLFTHLFAFLLKLLTESSIDSCLPLLTVIVVVLAYSIFNVYPAKIFNGNTGAFILGVTIPLMIAYYRLELYYIMASIPMFINGFYYIASVKGFLQKESVKRPTFVDEAGCIHSSKDSLAPITLVRLVTGFSRSGLSEKELVTTLYTVFMLSSLISLFLVMALGYR